MRFAACNNNAISLTTHNITAVRRSTKFMKNVNSMKVNTCMVLIISYKIMKAQDFYIQKINSQNYQ